MHQLVGANLLRAHVLTPKKARYKTSPTNMHQPVGANLFRAHVLTPNNKRGIKSHLQICTNL